MYLLCITMLNRTIKQLKLKFIHLLYENVSVKKLQGDILIIPIYEYNNKYYSIMMYIRKKSSSQLFWTLSKFRVVNVDGLCEMSFFFTDSPPL